MANRVDMGGFHIDHHCLCHLVPQGSATQKEKTIRQSRPHFGRASSQPTCCCLVMFFKAGTFFNSPIARGAFWKVSAFLCFSMINGIVRYLSQTSETLGTQPLPSYEVAFFQNFFG